MNEVEAISWQLELYKTVVSRQIDRLCNALEELQRITLLLLDQDVSENQIDEWLSQEGFDVDADGFYQSLPLLDKYREDKAPENAVSISWDGQKKTDNSARLSMFCHRKIGSHLKHIHDRLGDIGWIYYQDVSNTALQFPFIDQATAIPSDFDWSTYHTYASVCPEQNPGRYIRWTPPTIDYAGQGLIVSVSIPVYRDDFFNGLWSIDLPIRYLYTDFASTKVFQDQSQFIVNRSGLLLLHDRLQAEINREKGEVVFHTLTDLGSEWAEVALENIFDKPGGVIKLCGDDKTEWLYCFCTLPDVDWVFFSGVPRTSMEEAAAKRLQEAFQEIAEGKYGQRIDAPVTGALPMLVEEFNKMTMRLDQAERHRKDIERQLRQAQKMEAVGRLAGGVAHDYNNMTNVIMGYTELLMENLKEDDPAFADLQEIARAAKRSMELTRQLLAFARRQAIAPKVLKIDEAVESMLKILMRLIGEDIELTFLPGQGVGCIKIDPSQLDQILANLCVNARDAIQGCGKITIETDNVILDESYCNLHEGFRSGNYVRLAVSDTGSGMETAVLENIFEPFFSTKVVGHGTGLGLATVYGIVKQNNGFINVYSEPDIGSTFKIYFPHISGETEQVGLSSAAETIPGGDETILLVEDEVAILKLTGMMLHQLGYRVLSSHVPHEALRIAQDYNDRIDLLLTDVVMPGMNGNELAFRLQQLRPGLKVLYTSGYTANIIANHGVLYKDVLLLQKPFSKADLATMIRRALTDLTSGTFVE